MPGYGRPSYRIPIGKQVPGRPKINLGKFMIKPTHESGTGFEVLNDTPDALQRVDDLYLKAGEMPLALQPKYLRKPEVLETSRRRGISKGFIKPRSHVQ